MTASGPVLILGSTGMLGQALMACGISRGLAVVGAARHAADVRCDISDPEALGTTLRDLRPAVIINCAAITDLAVCEEQPSLAHAVNAQPVAILAEYCTEQCCRFVQISTDHYFRGDGVATHDEQSPVEIVNEYAKSKLAGEAFALAYPEALVVRTNVTGFRGWPGKPTFAEWMFAVIQGNLPAILFDDFVTSTIDAPSLARAVFDLCNGKAHGLLNVAAREAATKKQFVEAAARHLGLTLTRCTPGSVMTLHPSRANSLALDVGRAEAMLGYRLPTLSEVVSALAEEYGQRCATAQPST
jgi:dTDP-4-dehydrorhamnose reductase